MYKNNRGQTQGVKQYRKQKQKTAEHNVAT